MASPMSSSAIARRPSSSDDVHPPSKRLRRQDEDVGHPIEDDDTARRKLREAGFDPDQISKRVRGRKLRDFVGESMKVTPMIYFSYKGDLSMCRYLLIHGTRNDLTKRCSQDFWFPMYAAAYAGHVAVCQWLFNQGAEEVLLGRLYRSPLKASLSNGHVHVSKWLILNGALHPGGAFHDKWADKDLAEEGKIINRNLAKHVSSLKAWALDAVACHAAFHIFLMGTLPLPDDCTDALAFILSRKLLSEDAARFIIEAFPPEKHISLLRKLSSPVQVLGGYPDIVELVADFVGVVKRRRERDMLRDVANFLVKSGEGETTSS